MGFVAMTSTEDGRLTKGRIYYGALLMKHDNALRIAVYDNKGQWMTFDPNAFGPIEFFRAGR